MAYIGQTCSVCLRSFQKGDDLVVCPECGAPYHRDCYEKIGHCTYENLHAEGFDWEKEKRIPDKDEPKVAPVPETTQAMPMNNFHAFGGSASKGFSEQNLGNLDTSNIFEQIFKIGQEADKQVIDGYSQKELRTAVGQNSTYYLSFFRNFQDNRRGFSFSLAAFIGGFVFFFYRKMYKEAIPFLIISFAYLSVFSVVLIRNFPAFYQAYLAGIPLAMEMTSGIPWMDTLFSILSYANMFAPFIAGIMANGLYKRKIYSLIDHTRKNGTVGTPLYFNTLSKKGGVNRAIIYLAVLGVIVYFLGLNVIVSMVHGI